MNITKLLQERAQKYQDKPAVIFRDSALSFAGLKDISLKMAEGLSGLGVLTQDKVAIFLPNIPQYMFSFLGIFILRATAVPLDFMLTEEELVNFINHSESKVLIAQEKKEVELKKIKLRCPALEKVIILGDTVTAGEDFISWEQMLKAVAPLPAIEADESDSSAIFYTSGSTGHPKGVLLTYAHFNNPVECFEYFLHPNDNDSLICPGIPFSHLGGLDYMLLMLYFGVTMALMERFHPFEFLKNIERYKSTIFCIVPAMYVAILSLKEYDKLDLSSLRYAVVFGAPSSPLLLKKFHQACPNAYLLNGWGLTETAAPNSFLPTGTNTKEIPNTGKFMPGTEVKIVDEQGNALGDGQEGELWMKGRAIMAGYYKEPALTKEVLTQDGWFKTGDVVRRDEMGRHSIVGRKKEMIKVGGEIVFEPEVEEALQRHADVAEAAVVGVPDKLRGEVPKAFVALKEGKAPNAEELRVFLRQHLAHFKIPHHFEFVVRLPKNRTGKIDKASLRKQ
ncbi:MAG: acyl--CoA ligase [Candidatus Omnitrophica bacterium]|nr:acyl--CoA ligase [Candidatus Omnitrophota bacterium]